MKCPQCQAENREDAQFCAECGRKLEAICPVCGKTSPLHSKFCDGCGQALIQTTHPLEPETAAFVPGPSPAAERKHVTVLFSDLSGYTAMSEKLDPEEVREITSRIFGEVAKIVDRYEGFVEKYIGDAVVALFGVPKAHEDDHLRAIRAAKEIHEIVSTVGFQSEEKIGRRLTFHSGIATGLVVTGETNVEKGTHGVAGDTINLASRLSGLARPGEILVGESTYLQSKGAFSFERLRPAAVKGKTKPLIPYRLLEEKAEPAKGLAIEGISSPLVGRNAEIAAMRACVNRLLDGQGSILSVIGEAGLGKSRLMAEIRRDFLHKDILWLEGRTLSYGQKLSYWPFKEILKAYGGITEDDNDTTAWEKLEAKISGLFGETMDEILPYLAILLDIEVAGERGTHLSYLDGESMGKQVYLSTRRFFERVAQTRPVILIFEDLHWADESSVLLIEHLFPLISRVPLLICGVSRPEMNVAAVRLQETASRDYERRYTEIRLSPLSSTECVDLMDHLVPVENLPSRIRQLILTKAEGNPFFVEEIMRTLIERKAVIREGSHWKATAALDTITIPDTVQGVIMARIDRLDDELKQVLRTASVIGRAFLYRLLREVTEAVKELDRRIDDLTATELIREKQKVPELEYIFKHALVQESTYESILLKKRHELHGKVASAIESLFPERLDEFSTVLAYHYTKAEDWEKAQEYLFKAGDQAGRIAADAEALTHYQEALETYTRVFGEKWDPIQRGTLERKMGEALYRRGETKAAVEYLQRGLVYLGRPRLASSSLKVGLQILREIGVQIRHQIFAGRAARKPSGPADQIVQEVARIYETMIDLEVVMSPTCLLRTALTYLNYSYRTGYAPGIAAQCGTLGFIAFMFSLSRLERFYIGKSLALAEEAQHPSALIRAYMFSCATYLDRGQLYKAIDHGSKAAEICRRVGPTNLHVWAVITLGISAAYAFLGEIDKAERIAKEAIRVAEDANDPYVHLCGAGALFNVDSERGDFEHAIDNGRERIKILEAIPNHEFRIVTGCILAKCYLRSGETDVSLQILTETDAYRAKHHTRMYPYYVTIGFLAVYLALGERAAGRERGKWLKKAKGACRKSLRSARTRGIILPEATRLQGVYDWCTGRQSLARKRWERSIALAEEMGMRYELAMTHLEMGRRLKDLEHLRRAEAIFTEIGAEWDLAETRRLLERVQT